MRKYSIEFVGTFLFVFSILSIVHSGSALATLLIGWALATLVYMGWPISGGHYNPMVTFAIYFNRKMGIKDTISYIISQLLGAACAFLVIKYGFQFNMAPAVISNNIQRVFIAELIFTFALVSMVFHTAVNRLTAGNNYYGAAIGGIVAVGATAVGNISGWFFNPAVLLGVGLLGIETNFAIAIVVAQLLWALIAERMYRMVVGK